MDFLFIIAVVLFLYSRTWNYNLLIDDNVKRDRLLWDITTKRIDHSFYDQKRTLLSVVENITVLTGSCFVLYFKFGFWPALLYAVFPVNVSSAAWVTGGFYQTTVFLTLTADYLLGMDNFVWHIIAGIIYWGALESTVSAIPYALIAPVLYWPHGLIALVPLIFFLTGKRFNHALKIRKARHDEMAVESGELKLDRFYVVFKVIGYYLRLVLFPDKLGFFHSFGNIERNRGVLAKATPWFFVSLTAVMIVGYISYQVSPWCFFWMSLIIIHSQYTTYGQFVTERYTFLFNAGFVVFISLIIHDPIIKAVIATLYFCRSLSYIPNWRNIEALFIYSMTQFPEAPENHVNYASRLIEKKRWLEAIKPLQMALKVVTGDKSAMYTDLACCFAKCQIYDKALAYTQEAMKTCTKDKFEDLKSQAWDLMEKVRRTHRLRKQLASA